MGLFNKRSSSVSSGSSSISSSTASTASSQYNSSSASSSSQQIGVNPADLPFLNTVSTAPNSRLLVAHSDDHQHPQRSQSYRSKPAATSPKQNDHARSASLNGARRSSSKPDIFESESDSEQEQQDHQQQESDQEQDEEEEDYSPAPRRSSSSPAASKMNQAPAVTTNCFRDASSRQKAAPAPTVPSSKQRRSPPAAVESSSSGSESEESVESDDESSDDERAKPVKKASHHHHHHHEQEHHASSKRAGAGGGASNGRAMQEDLTTRNGKKLSHAARLAAASRASKPLQRQSLNKPLTSLKLQDVALSDADLREDIGEVWKALHLFLDSQMFAAENICKLASDHRLYYSVGYSLIQVIKSIATFEPEDLESAIGCCKDSILITNLLRKKDHGALESVGRLVKGSTSVGSIKNMTLVQRHAELVFAECTLLKAVIGIIYSGDFIAFLKEALNMRNAYSIYRTLAKFVETSDEECGGEGKADIDEDFRSGVFLGNGMISLILSLLPSTVLKLMEVFGFTGDREYALRTLMKGGKWEAGKREPGMAPEKEGIRRQVCDMVLLAHHLVISSYLPVGGVDVPTADAILHYNLERYPRGVFFLYFSGRLYSTQTMTDTAEKQFHLAINAQKEYVQLQHICYWDLGLISLATGKYAEGYDAFTILDKDSNWSKAIYAYAKGVSLYEQGKSEANKTIKNVPDLMRRIAGKSIPLEKFVARRATKFIEQNNRLLCPGIELAYVFNCLGMSPRSALFKIHLRQVSKALGELHACKNPSSWGTGTEYWDDYCLAHLLRGVILRFIAHPEPHAKVDLARSPIPVAEADEQALISFNNVFEHGTKIVADRHLVWFAHYELGRLYADMGQNMKAAVQFEMVLNGGKAMETNPKVKITLSLRNMVVLRSNAALVTLNEKGRK